MSANGVNNTGGKFVAGVVNTGGNLLPVSTTLVKLVAKFAAGVVDTGGKFATGVVDTGAWWSTLSCEYLLEFSKKFETALMVYSGAWGKLIHEKNQKQKIS